MNQKKTFSIDENRMGPLGILHMPQNIWSKVPEDICF